jgi:hypothetical protein
MAELSLHVRNSVVRVYRKTYAQNDERGTFHVTRLEFSDGTEVLVYTDDRLWFEGAYDEDH